MPTGAKFCPNCATPVASQRTEQVPTTPAQAQELGTSQPRGPRILMLIDFAVGIVLTAFGVLVITLAPGVGAIFVVVGVLSLTVGYGLRKARSWTWLLGLWAGVVYVVLGILFVSAEAYLEGIGSIVFGGGSIYYLNRVEVKRYLGKSRR